MTRSTPVLKAVIPAAGLGTRFLPATKASPKEMLPLVDKPLIQYVVEEAVASGIREVIVVTGRGKRAIEDHFDVSVELEEVLRENGRRGQLKAVREISELAAFCYVRQRRALGLGHAVLCARSVIGDQPFAVMLGDEIMDAHPPALDQLITLYRKYRAPVIGIQPVEPEAVSRYGIVKAVPLRDGLYRITDLVEKPKPSEAPSTLAVIGRYILTPEIFPALERLKPSVGGELQLTDALRALARRRPIYGVIVRGRRHDAGDKLGFLKATVEFGLKNPEFGSQFRAFLKTLPL